MNAIRDGFDIDQILEFTKMNIKFRARGRRSDPDILPLPGKGQRIVYRKMQFHERPAISLALLLELDEGGTSVTDARVAVGCVSPTPRRGLCPC